MLRLTLRTLLAYLDDTLEAEEARELGQKIADNPEAQQLIERIKRVTRRRGLGAPSPVSEEDAVTDPNTVAEYLDNVLESEAVRQLEAACLQSDALLAEVAACHQILTLVLTEPVRVPPAAYQRMYRLVPAPLADHQRRPGKAPSLTPLPPPTPEYADADEPDIALLLGLKRYDASDTWRGRVGLFSAVAACLLLLVVAVWMALPSTTAGPDLPRIAATDLAQAPSTSGDHPEASSSPTTGKTDPSEPQSPGQAPKKARPTPLRNEIGPPKEFFPPREGKEGTVVPPPMPLPPAEGVAVAPPLPGREEIGRWAQPDLNVFLIVRENRPDASWLRVDLKNPALFTDDFLMALPGYRTDLVVKKDLIVHLWGNVPEQYAAPLATPLEACVRLHPPIAGLDADLTLERGRIYLTNSRKADDIRVRLRLADEVWDCTLKPNSELMVQLHQAFVPGTPLARVGGEPPRLSAVVAVMRESISFHAPKRFKKYQNLSTGTLLQWDSLSGQLSDPQPLPKEDLRYTRFPLQPANAGQQVLAALNTLATDLKERDGLRVYLESRLQPAPLSQNVNVLQVSLAVYAYAAIVEGPEAADMASNLFDLLRDTDRPYVRRAAHTAVSAWLARQPTNTKLFWDVLTGKKQLPDEEADIILHLLRGYSSRDRRDAAEAVDQLVDWLNHPNLVIREAALGNLVAFFDPTIVERRELIDIPLTQRGDPTFANFLANWRKWAEQFKRQLPSALPKQ